VAFEFSVVVTPVQITLGPEIEAVGNAFTETDTDAVAVHPFASVV
jgi:hypothetical protein